MKRNRERLPNSLGKLDYVKVPSLCMFLLERGMHIGIIRTSRSSRKLLPMCGKELTQVSKSSRRNTVLSTTFIIVTNHFGNYTKTMRSEDLLRTH